MNSLTREIIPFKSLPEYYIPEVEDKKNNTLREIDWEDERFHILELMRIRNQYGYLEITNTEKCNSQIMKFQRRIKHICKWNKFMIITWEEA